MIIKKKILIILTMEIEKPIDSSIKISEGLKENIMKKPEIYGIFDSISKSIDDKNIRN